MALNVLYLSPLIPATSGSGGKRAIYNHLAELKRHGVNCKLIAIDEDDVKASYPAEFACFAPEVFPRALPRVGNGLVAKAMALIQLFFCKRPRSAAVIASKQAKRAYARLAADGGFDAVIVDHLNAYSIAEGEDFSLPLVYIAHNIEAEVLKDRLQMLPPWSPERLRTRLEYVKMRRFERGLIEKARHIVLISSADRNSALLHAVQDKVSIWPELPTVREIRWRYQASKKMLFVGSAKYFPNEDAIRWLVEQLMPEIRRIDGSVTLTIAGTSNGDLYLAYADGVSFTGFVSDAELEALHLHCDLFISPVVLGSGIKIKVLEASSYGMPIMATKESLAGINYLDGENLQLTRDPKQDAQNIIRYLYDPEALRNFSQDCLRKLSRAHEEREFMLEMLAAEQPRG